MAAGHGGLHDGAPTALARGVVSSSPSARPMPVFVVGVAWSAGSMARGERRRGELEPADASGVVSWASPIALALRSSSASAPLAASAEPSAAAPAGAIELQLRSSCVSAVFFPSGGPTLAATMGEMALGADGLPTQLYAGAGTAGAAPLRARGGRLALLAAPIALNVHVRHHPGVGAQPVRWVVEQPAAIVGAPSQQSARWAASLASADGALRLGVRGEWQFDAQAFLELTLSATRDVALDDVELLLPLVAARARHARTPRVCTPRTRLHPTTAATRRAVRRAAVRVGVFV